MTSEGPGDEEIVPGVRFARLGEPVEQYVGLTFAEAELLAATEGRTLRLGIEGRMNLVTNRVKVDLDAAGLVCRAKAG